MKITFSKFKFQLPNLFFFKKFKFKLKLDKVIKMNSLEIHKNAEEELFNVLKGVINHGENNSALVIGPRGSGKTFMIKKILAKITKELEAKDCSNEFILVNLSGNLLPQRI